MGGKDVACTELSQVNNLASTLDELPSSDVIFLDLEFPKSNAYEILVIIKQHSRFKTVPVIAYTVHGSELDIAFDNGFDGFLGNSLDAEHFQQQLQ